jgi:glycosyltransferase involved in cell wall biosynthesis
MRILINCASTFKGGSMQVARSIIYQAARDKRNEYIVAHGPNLSAFVAKIEPSTDLTLHYLKQRPSERLRRLSNPGAELSRIESRYIPDVIFTTSGPSYWRPKAPHLVGFNLGHFIYPDSPFFRQVSPLHRLKWKVRGLAIKLFLKHDADFFVVQTDDANQRLRNWLRTEHVYTVSNTISDIFLDSSGLVNTSPPTNSSNFKVLVLSAYYPHKNLEIVNSLVELAKAARVDDLRFVLTLPPNDFAKAIHTSNRDFVENVGPISPEQCPALYVASDIVFLPTLLECFSVTYLEAMAMRRPIVTTRLGFSQSICGDAALYYKPTDPKDAFTQIMTLKHEKSKRDDLVEVGRRRLEVFGGPEERFHKYLQILQGIRGL